eukprot:g302.t1
MASTSDLENRILARLQKHHSKLKKHVEGGNKEQSSAKESVAKSKKKKKWNAFFEHTADDIILRSPRKNQDTDYTFQPEISELSEKLAKKWTNREPKVVERLYKLAPKEHDTKLQSFREASMLRYAEEPSYFPKTNQEMNAKLIGVREGDIASRTKAWIQNQSKKMEQLREDLDREEDENLQVAPNINARSIELARRQRSKGYTVQDELYLDAERKRIWRAERQEKMCEDMQERPRITRVAQRLADEGKIPSGNVTRRLYEDALIQQQRQELNSERVTDTQHGKSQKWKKGFGEAVGCDLHRRAELTRLKKERMLERKFEDVKRRAHPRLNARSLKLAARTGETSAERLYKPSNEMKRYISQAVREELEREQRELTFHPHINQTSLDLADAIDARNLFDAKFDRFDKLFHEGVAKMDRIDDLREEKEELELAECTFQPRVHCNPDSTAPSNRNRWNSIKPFAERNMTWMEKREKFLRDERLKKAEERDDECTFQPQINHRHGRSGIPKPSEVLLHRFHDFINHLPSWELLEAEFQSRDVESLGRISPADFNASLDAVRFHMTMKQRDILLHSVRHQDHGMIEYRNIKLRIRRAVSKHKVHKESKRLSEMEDVHPGIASFLQRQRRAREEAKLRKNVPYTDGSGWKNQTTIPVAPTFHSRMRKRPKGKRRPKRQEDVPRQSEDLKKKKKLSKKKRTVEQRGALPGSAKNMYASDVAEAVWGTSDPQKVREEKSWKEEAMATESSENPNTKSWKRRQLLIEEEMAGLQEHIAENVGKKNKSTGKSSSAKLGDYARLERWSQRLGMEEKMRQDAGRLRSARSRRVSGNEDANLVEKDTNPVEKEKVAGATQSKEKSLHAFHRRMKKARAKGKRKSRLFFM